MKKMNDILKRKVSVGLVAVMLVSQTPVTAFASEMPEFKTEQPLKIENLISEPTEDEPAEAEEIFLRMWLMPCLHRRFFRMRTLNPEKTRNRRLWKTKNRQEKMGILRSAPGAIYRRSLVQAEMSNLRVM